MTLHPLRPSAAYNVSALSQSIANAQLQAEVEGQVEFCRIQLDQV